MAVGLLQGLLYPGALANLALQRAVRRLELGVGALQAAVDDLELAGLLLLQRDIGLGEARVRVRQLLVRPLQLLALAVELHQHRYLAAQDLRHDRHRHVIDGAERVALEPVEVIADARPSRR